VNDKKLILFGILKGVNYMGFLKDLGGKLQDVIETATDKAKDFAEVTKLNNAISAEEKQIKQYYLEIGQLIFEQFKDKPDSPVAEYRRGVLSQRQSAVLRRCEELHVPVAVIRDYLQDVAALIPGAAVKTFPLAGGDVVQVTRSPRSVRLVKGGKDYYEVLRTKLKWGER
jgi:hypothetical protein